VRFQPILARLKKLEDRANDATVRWTRQQAYDWDWRMRGITDEMTVLMEDYHHWYLLSVCHR
jgi:hypothetical protein